MREKLERERKKEEDREREEGKVGERHEREKRLLTVEKEVRFSNSKNPN